MEQRNQTLLVLHGAVVLFVGNLFGFPLGFAIADGASAEVVRAWQAAHSAVTAGGVMLIAIGAAAHYIALGPRAASWLVWSLMALGYGAIVGLGLGAAAGARGFLPTGPALNLIAFVGNLAVMSGSLVGIALVIHGAYAALRKAS